MERIGPAILAVWYSPPSPSPEGGAGFSLEVLLLGAIAVLLLLNLVASLTRRQ